MLRESREKERHQKLAKVSQQIVSPDHLPHSNPNRPPLSGHGQVQPAPFSIGLPPSGMNGTP